MSSRGQIDLDQLVKRYGDVVAVDGIDLHMPGGEFFTLLGPSGCGKTSTLRLIAGLREARFRRDQARRRRHGPQAAAQAAGQHGLPVLRAVPAHDRGRERRVRAALPEVRQGGDHAARGRGDGDGPARRAGRAAAGAALRRPAAAGRAGAGDRARAARAAARRAAGRAGRAAARGPAGRAQAHPGDARDHVRLRHPRPGRGADDERPRRGDEGRARRAVRRAARALRAARDRLRGELPRRLEPDPGDGFGRWPRGRRVHAAGQRQRADGRGAGDDPARARAARAARRRRREPRAGDGRGGRLPRLPPGRARAAGVRARWCAATSPTTARRSSTPRATPCRCTCRRTACGSWSHEAPRGARRPRRAA